MLPGPGPVAGGGPRGLLHRASPSPSPHGLASPHGVRAPRHRRRGPRRRHPVRAQQAVAEEQAVATRCVRAWSRPSPPGASPVSRAGPARACNAVATRHGYGPNQARHPVRPARHRGPMTRYATAWRATHGPRAASLDQRGMAGADVWRSGAPEAVRSSQQPTRPQESVGPAPWVVRGPAWGTRQHAAPASTSTSQHAALASMLH
jgi:hypothetical protein